MSWPRRLGILGGTFDPVHVGHLVAAVNVRHELALDKVLMVVANEPWQKVGSRPLTAAGDRLALVQAAVAGVDGLEASAIEIERGGPSYTVDTLRAIKQSDPEAELTFIVGADMARTLPGWREPGALVGLARLAVAEREDAGRGQVLRALAPLGARVEFLEMPPVEVSSSQVRERVAGGEPVEDLVGSAVAEYIAEHGLYRATVAAR